MNVQNHVFLLLNLRKMVSWSLMRPYSLACRSPGWRKQEEREVMCLTVTVELESTESRQVVEVWPVVCTTKGPWWTNSKWECFCWPRCSHPGYFGKTGMRRFHRHNNHKFCPTVNTDKLWTLVSEHTRNAAARNKDAKSKDKTPVIDVTKSVSARFLYSIN